MSLLLRKFISAFLTEAALDRTALNKRKWRYDRFVEFVRTGKLFKVGAKPPYKETPITLQISDKVKKKVLYPTSDLNDKKEFAAFEDWMQKGKLSKFDVRPVWGGVPNSWDNLYKDPQNFQFEEEKSGTVPEKALTPSSLGLAGRLIPAKNEAEFKAAVKGKFDENIESILIGLIDAAFSNGSIAKATQDLLTQTDEGDKRKIIKDFGEVLAAIMLAKTEKFPNIRFPLEVNNPLSDFELVKGKGKSEEVAAYSVKGLTGSAASMKNYLNALSDVSKIEGAFNKVEQSAVKALLATQSSSLHNTVLSLSQSPAFSKSPEVKETLAKLKSATGFNGTLTDEELYEHVMKSKNPKKIIKTYYDMDLPARPKADLAEIMSVALTSDLVKSLLIYPVLRAMLNEMNSDDSIFKNVFSKAANQMTASQAFINFDNMDSPKKISVNVKPFKGVNPQDVKFGTKAGATTFKQGGIGVAIK